MLNLFISGFFHCTWQNICVRMRFQELWATDSNKVHEFMFSYLKDPLREVEQPYFHQDEVGASSPLFTYGILQTRRKNCKLVFVSNVFQCSLLCCQYLWEMLRQ